jgi:prepilin-type N-terminal cleavage/methylation domain-containing protein
MKDNNEKGFTLVELMIAMVISAIVMTSVYSVYSAQQRSYIVQEGVAAMHQNLRAAMYFMEREIRMAGCDPKGSANAAIEGAETSRIRISMDFRGQALGSPPDGHVLVAQHERIEYFLDGSNLVRDLNPIDDYDAKTPEEKNDMVIAENIQSLKFTYRDSTSAITAVPENIRFVEIALEATSDDGSQTDTLQTRIHARNLGM